jgi:hypothetical protein
MKDARGLDVTADHADAVAAADDFAARLLRLDQGVEAVLDAVKRWPQTPILQLYTRRSGSMARPARRSRTPPAISRRARHSP